MCHDISPQTLNPMRGLVGPAFAWNGIYSVISAPDRSLRLRAAKKI
jgi:hypothetical protein